jgi:uncharacterized membrane protein YhaH (DUF805 family)
MDLPSLNAFLRVNGLSAQSTPEQITAALRGAGYGDGEMQEALSIIHGEAPTHSHAAPQEYLKPILELTSTPGYVGQESSLYGGRINVREFWIALIAACVLFTIFFLILEVTVVPLFTLASGVSFLALPDLALAPLRVVLLVGIGAALFVIPFISFLVLACGLHIRRFHDFGLSGATWFCGSLAGGVVLFVSSRYPQFTLLGVASIALIYAIIMSLPGSHEENQYGLPIPHVSIWGSMMGSHEACTASRLLQRFVLPVIYVQGFGLILAFSVHSIFPRVQLPHISTPHVDVPGATLREAQMK